MQSEQQGANLKIFSYDFADFLQQFQQAIRDGYCLNYSTTETYPFTSVGQYWVTLVPGKEAVATLQSVVPQEEEVKQKDVVETQQEVQKKVGRKPKAE